MKVLLTGASGYIGQNLLYELLHGGHYVICCVRNPDLFQIPEGFESQAEVVEADFLCPNTPKLKDRSIDVAYYLIHSMKASIKDFDEMESTAARNFLSFLEATQVSQIIYLSGISNEPQLSRHLQSRNNVEQVLREGNIPVTVLRAGIIVGAGSASFELIRDLVEKLPVMVAPKWLMTKCQPIAIQNILEYLTRVALRTECLDKTYDIGGNEVLTYREMLLQYANVRGLKRSIITVPVMTPRLSSYWLYFVTSVSYELAVNLVDSMKVEVVCTPNKLANLLKIKPVSYRESIRNALYVYHKERVRSSWKDALSSSFEGRGLRKVKKVPTNGVLTDKRLRKIAHNSNQVLQNIWSIGGNNGWYYGTWLWKLRGFIDKLFGGVGLRRGRTHPEKLEAGDALDFWRVLEANREAGRLLLYAEMKLPGEAWLEFRIRRDREHQYLEQTATFQPKGLWGRAYWYLVSPFHFFLFQGMLKKLVTRHPVTNA